MEVRGLSATAIKDFLVCVLKIVFRYDRDIPGIKTEHAILGTAVHAALEQFTKRMLTKKSFPDPSDYEFAIATFMNAATSEGLDNIAFYAEGRKMITQFIDRHDPMEKVLATEYRFNKLTTPEGVPIVGAIDKIVQVDDETIAIIDYKTSRNALTPSELQDDIQLSMYDLAASIIWPQFPKRILSLEYVRIDKKVFTSRSDEDRVAFRQFLQSIWTQINNIDENDVQGRANRLCGWCDYKNYCPTYAEVVSSTKLNLPPLTALSDGDFLDHWDHISAMRSMLEERSRELKMLAHERFMQGQEIRAGGRELYSVQQSRTTYDVEDIVDLIPRKDLLSVLTVNKSKLDGYSREDAELRNKLSGVAQVSYNSPIYKTRGAKEVSADEEFDENESAA